MRRIAQLLFAVFCTVTLPAWANPGTDFWAVYSRSSASTYPFFVSVANPDSIAFATVTIETEVGVVASGSIAPRLSRVFDLGNSRYVELTGHVTAAYRIRSDRPVHAYQFYDFPDITGTTSGATLLDRSAFGTEYLAVAARADDRDIRPSVVTIVSPGPAVVKVTPKQATQPGGSVPPLAAGVEVSFNMNAFEVLQIGSLPLGDMTGTSIIADAPVEVFAGCTACVVSTSAADEVQEVMIPAPLWGSSAVAVSSLPASEGIDLWRIVAASDGTVVTTDPPQPGTPVNLNRGEMWERFSRDNFVVTANQPIQLARIISPIPPSLADPAMCLMLGPERFISSAVFAMTDSFPSFMKGWLDIVAAPGASVTVDGVLVPASAFTPVASSGYSRAQVLLDVAKVDHSVEASEPIGVYVTHDGSGSSQSYPADISFPPNLAPVCNHGGPYSVACDGPQSTLVATAAGSSDPESQPLRYRWFSIDPGVQISDATVVAPAITITGIGSFPLNLEVDDGYSVASCATIITITGDPTPPTELCLPAAPLWLTRAGSDILFSWEDRGSAPVSYNLYEGNVRVLNSHVPLLCGAAGAPSAGGRREATLSVGAGNRYFLVTSANCAAEGPSGADPALSICPP